MSPIKQLDDTRRCALCRHFYYRPHGNAEQLPLRETRAGLICQRCEREFLDAHWPQISRKGIWGREGKWWRIEDGWSASGVRRRKSPSPPSPSPSSRS